MISSRSFVVEGILDILRQNVFDKVTSRDDIPKEFGTREDMKKASELLQRIYKDHLRHAKVSTEGICRLSDSENEYTCNSVFRCWSIKLDKYEEEEMETAVPMVVEMDTKKLDETVEAKEATRPSVTEDEESKILDEVKEITTEGNDLIVYVRTNI